jgi:hypothetical protein
MTTESRTSICSANSVDEHSVKQNDSRRAALSIEWDDANGTDECCLSISRNLGGGHFQIELLVHGDVARFLVGKIVANNRAALDSVAAPVPQQENDVSKETHLTCISEANDRQVVERVAKASDMLWALMQGFTAGDKMRSPIYQRIHDVVRILEDVKAALSALPQQRVWTREGLEDAIISAIKSVQDERGCFKTEDVADALIAANVVKVES